MCARTCTDAPRLPGRLAAVCGRRRRKAAANILVSTTGAAMLSDFGAARVLRVSEGQGGWQEGARARRLCSTMERLTSCCRCISIQKIPHQFIAQRCNSPVAPALTLSARHPERKSQTTEPSITKRQSTTYFYVFWLFAKSNGEINQLFKAYFHRF